MEKRLPPSFMLFSFYIFFFFSTYSVFLFCSFLNPSSLQALHINLHVTSVFHFNPVKFTVVPVSFSGLSDYLRREAWLAGTAK